MPYDVPMVSISSINTYKNYETLHNMTLQAEKTLRTSWVHLGLCLYHLKIQGLIKNLKKYVEENLNIGYSVCKGTYQAIIYIKNNHDSLLKNDNYLNKFPDYGSVNLIKCARKKYPDSKELDKLEATLFSGLMKKHEFLMQKKLIISNIEKKSSPSELNQKVSDSSTYEINIAIEVIRGGLLKLRRDKELLLLKSIQEVFLKSEIKVTAVEMTS